jgi:hypothetical protein
MRIQQVSEEGIFTKWQPQYAERRIATFPVKADKKPAIRRWNQITLKGSSRLAERFHESDAFGFQLGPKSQITALDVDSRDEAVLADALTCHGDTPSLSARVADITPITAMAASGVIFAPTTTSLSIFSVAAL